MTKGFCHFCNRKVDLMEVGFRRCFEEQQYKCSLCGEPVRPKRNNLFIILLLLGIVIIGFLALINPVSSLAVSGTVDLDHEIGQIRSDFYGVIGTSWFGDSRLVDTNHDGVTDTASNLTWHRNTFINMGLNNLKVGSSLDTLYSNITGGNGVNMSGNMNETINATRWVYENNLSITIQIGYMPSWLADNSSGLCNNSLTTCYPNNYTKWRNIVLDYLNRTTNGGQYNGSVNVEVWNEPSSTYFLSTAPSDANRTYYYNILWNETYQAIHSVYTNMFVSGVNGDETQNVFFTNWIGNFSYLDDLTISRHRYRKTGDGNYDYGNILKNDISYLYNNCTANSVSCSHILISEWNEFNGTITNSSQNTYEGLYRTILSGGYSGVLNNYPANISMNLFYWSSSYWYDNVTKNSYNPKDFRMVSEPQTENKYLPSYNITKLFATNHKAGNTVINSTTNRSDLKIVASKDTSGKYYVTLTNTNSSTMNVTVDTGLENQHLRFYDVEDNSTKYNVRSDGTISLTNMAGYDVITLASEPVRVSVPFATQIGQVREDFYGVYGIDMLSDAVNRNMIDTDGNGVLDTYANYTWERNRFDEVNFNTGRTSISLYTRYSNITGGNGVNFSGNFNRTLNTIKYLNLTGRKALIIIDTMPSWLADNSSGMCNQLYYCPANNWTKWNNIINDTVYRLTENLTLTNVMFEIMNEVEYSSNWMSKLTTDNITRFYNYSILYNHTYSTIKRANPNIMVGGYGATDVQTYTNFLNGFLSNHSQQMDFFSLHIYDTDISTYISSRTNYLLTRCAIYNANCSYIMWDEWNTNNASILNETDNGLGSVIGSGYATLLNYAPNNITSMIYSWSSQYKYGSYQENYPRSYPMVSEPQLDNKIRASFNISKKYTHYTPALSTIYNSSSDNSEIKVVSSKIGQTESIILTNTYNGEQNISLEVSGVNTLVDVDTKQVYDVSDGDASIVVAEYGVTTLTEPVYRLAGGDWYMDNYFGDEIRELTDDEARTLGLADTHQGMGSTCDSTTISFYQIILNLAALALIGYIFYWGTKDGLDDLDVRKILIMGIGLVVGVILCQSSADNLGIAGCG